MTADVEGVSYQVARALYAAEPEPPEHLRRSADYLRHLAGTLEEIGDDGHANLLRFANGNLPTFCVPEIQTADGPRFLGRPCGVGYPLLLSFESLKKAGFSDYELWRTSRRKRATPAKPAATTAKRPSAGHAR